MSSRTDRSRLVDSREHASARRWRVRAVTARDEPPDRTVGSVFSPTRATRTVLGVLGGCVSLTMASTPALAHEPSTATTAQGLGFGAVLALTVVVGVLGGFVVLRWQRPTGRRLSTPGVALLLVVLGCWATVLAALEGIATAAVGVAVGGVATWSLRNRISGGHHVCDQAALGAVVTHRVVEGAIVATLYAASAALGTGAALVLAGHAAAETGAIAGLWSTSRWRWGVVAVVQAEFVVGAVGGTAVLSSLGSLTHGLVLALLGGILIAAGVAAESRRRTAMPA